MSKFLENSVGAGMKSDQKARYNLNSYRSAFSTEMDRDLSANFVMNIVGLLLWYCIAYPALFILHFLLQCLLAVFTKSKVKNKSLRNPIK